MADNVVETPGAEGQVADPKVELAQHMALALNGGILPENQEQPAADAGGAAAEQPAAASVTDYFSPIKEKFGYQSHEDAIRDIEELRAFKAAPPTVEMEFENEDSEKLLRAIAKGDRATVYQILHKEQQLNQYINADVTADNAADIVKLGMQLKYKDQDLSPSEIEYKFKKTFAIPPKPVQLSGEDEIEYNERVVQWQEAAEDKKMELVIEAKLAKSELAAAKTNLVLPDIESPEDEGYLQYKKMLEDQTKNQEEQTKRDAQIQAIYKAFTPKHLETKLNFIDEPNKINFEFQYEPDAESFGKVQEMVADTSSFFNSFKNPDGTPDHKGFLEAIYFAKNKDKIIMEAIKQGKNAAIKASLPDNSQGGMVRHMTTVPEMSELDKQMQLAGIKR